ncbi:MAG: response regulator [Pseudorhodoplanes sp.]|nr:response regulator [Pseudorhodoplanes sp.]
MIDSEKVNILLVDDQPGKLLTYEAILSGLGENLLKATSGREALEHLLKSDIAVILVDVCMPDLDGFQLAAMIREHPRYQKIAMIFISAIHLSELDRLRGYEMGAVDYVPVPVVPELLRAKVRVFADLYRKTRDLENLNAELEKRVAERTAELEASTAQLLQSEQRRSLALAAGKMGGWDWDRVNNLYFWDQGQRRIFGVGTDFVVTAENIRALIYPDDLTVLDQAWDGLLTTGTPLQMEYRVRRPNGDVRWCLTSAAATHDAAGALVRVSGVTIDITDRKAAEERQTLLSREVDHRAKNALALVQSIVRLTRHTNPADYSRAIEGRINALSRVHTVLSQSRWQGADLGGLLREELAPFRTGEDGRIDMQGPELSLEPARAQTLALALHELTTNAAKYGALSGPAGRLRVHWAVAGDHLNLEWHEENGSVVAKPDKNGFGTKIIVSSIEGQLGGRVKHNWRTDGVSCVISIPLVRTFEAVQNSGSMPAKPNGSAAKLHPGISAAQTIMVVEDEALVALSLHDFLSELGYSVVGPVGRVAEALRILNQGPVDAAILDVNLAGEFVYPLAELLRTRNIPFVFATGYSSESIDPRFGDISVLQKPIDRQMLETCFARRVDFKISEPLATEDRSGRAAN